MSIPILDNHDQEREPASDLTDKAESDVDTFVQQMQQAAELVGPTLKILHDLDAELRAAFAALSLPKES